MCVCLYIERESSIAYKWMNLQNTRFYTCSHYCFSNIDGYVRDDIRNLHLLNWFRKFLRKSFVVKTSHGAVTVTFVDSGVIDSVDDIISLRELLIIVPFWQKINLMEFSRPRYWNKRCTRTVLSTQYLWTDEIITCDILRRNPQCQYDNNHDKIGHKEKLDINVFFLTRSATIWMHTHTHTYIYIYIIFQRTIIEYRKGVYRFTNGPHMILTSIKVPCFVLRC